VYYLKNPGPENKLKPIIRLLVHALGFEHIITLPTPIKKTQVGKAKGHTKHNCEFLGTVL
jgi:hypothetical protein